MSKNRGTVFDPGDIRKLVRKNTASTFEEREYARELNKEMPGEWRAISRRVFRKFGIDRSPSSIRGWCSKEESDGH